jgi:acetylornithine deacetylase/succinyl-diaminopimelate desuccinylase-like protein
MGENAVTRAAEAILMLKFIMDIEGTPPDVMKEVLTKQNQYIETNPDQAYKGRTWLTTHPSYNPSIIHAGVRHNVIPHECIVKIDIRLPLGITYPEMKEIVSTKLTEKRFSDITIEYGEENFNFNPDFTDPNNPFPQLVKRNVREVTGKDPIFQMTYGGADTRHIRLRGIPAVVFGPRSFNTGGFNEYVRANDPVVTAKVHGLTLFDFLASQ